MHFGLQARLDSGAEDAEDLVAAAEFAGYEGGNGGGAYVGEMPGIGEEGYGFAGFGGREEHHAVADGDAAREVAGKRGGDLEHEVPAAPAIAALHVDFGTLGGDGEVHGHRHIAFSAAPGDDGVAHERNDVPVYEEASDLGEFENAH